MTDFYRFPRTPHLSWLGPDRPRDDKVLGDAECRDLLSHVVSVEEKIDGANVGLSVGPNGTLRAQNRGDYIAWEPVLPQFKPLRLWIASRGDDLVRALGSDLILFGEWCYAQHSILYTRLPDWFLVFDVYSRGMGRFWSAQARDAVAKGLGLAVVPRIARGRFDLADIVQMLGTSRLADAPAEGLYLRWDEGQFLQQRAKLVAPEFTQAITAHWARRSLRPNQCAPAQHSRLGVRRAPE